MRALASGNPSTDDDRFAASTCDTSEAIPAHGSGLRQPIMLRTTAGRGLKAFVVIFVCMSSKALHLDAASDYSADAFLATFLDYARYFTVFSRKSSLVSFMLIELHF